MKKTLGIILAVLLTLMLSVPAFAQDITGGASNATANQEVSATYKDPTTSSTGNVYYVNITWGSQSGDLTYSAGNTAYTWDGSSMTYKADGTVTGDGWTGSASVEVTVANRSNAGITATGTGSSAYGLAISADKALTLNTAAVKDGKPLEVTSTEQGTEQSDKITFTIGSNNSKTTWGGTGAVGTLTVTIAPQQP